MFRRRRKIRYYNGPAYAERITQKIWFPFAAAAVAALVLGFVLGLILSGVSADSKLARLPRQDLTAFGGVEDPSEKYAAVADIGGMLVDLSDMGESDLKKAISGDGNAAGLLVFDGAPRYDSALSVGYDDRGTMNAATLVSVLRGKNKYSVAIFISSAFSVSDAAQRTYEKGRELAILSELAQAGFDEILICGLPSAAARVTEEGLFVAEVKAISAKSRVGVVLDGEWDSDAQARLVAATETSADSFALDVSDMDIEAARDAVERSAYYLTQYRMRVLVDADTDVSEDYVLSSCLVWQD